MNTRKWSICLLLIARLFRLKAAVDYVISEFEEDGLPSIDWIRLEAARAVLWPIYMFLQRDRANAIHLARSFQVVWRNVDLYVNHLRAAGEHGHLADHLQSSSKITTSCFCLLGWRCYLLRFGHIQLSPTRTLSRSKRSSPILSRDSCRCGNRIPANSDSLQSFKSAVPRARWMR